MIKKVLGAVVAGGVDISGASASHRGSSGGRPHLHPPEGQDRPVADHGPPPAGARSVPQREIAPRGTPRSQVDFATRRRPDRAAQIVFPPVRFSLPRKALGLAESGR